MGACFSAPTSNVAAPLDGQGDARFSGPLAALRSLFQAQAVLSLAAEGPKASPDALQLQLCAWSLLSPGGQVLVVENAAADAR